nr:Sb-PDE family phosphodiesterase [Bacteroidales bacterium]
HKRLLSKGWLHGIEFFNGKEHYPLVFTWCKQYNLTLMGNSDTHGVISESYQAPDYPNRPMTLAFAKEKSHDSLKEALFAGRTMVWFGNTLAGREEYAAPFVNACISVRKPYYQNDKNIFFEVENDSDIPFILVNGPKDAPETITLQARSVTRVALSKKVLAPLVYDVKNVLTGENEVLKIELKY